METTIQNLVQIFISHINKTLIIQVEIIPTLKTPNIPVMLFYQTQDSGFRPKEQQLKHALTDKISQHSH